MNEPIQASRPMRADAQRNYLSLLNAALTSSLRTLLGQLESQLERCTVTSPSVRIFLKQCFWRRPMN